MLRAMRSCSRESCASRLRSRPPARANPIDVVEAAYEIERDDRDWLANMAKLVRPLLDGGKGVMAYAFDTAGPHASWSDSLVVDGLSRSDAEMMMRVSLTDQQRAPMHVDPEAYGTMRETAKRVGLDAVLADPAITRE